MKQKWYPIYLLSIPEIGSTNKIPIDGENYAKIPEMAPKIQNQHTRPL